MTGAQPPGGGQDRKDKPWEYALDSDAQMTSVAVTETLSGYCWAGGLGWRRYDEATGAWPAVPEEDTVDRVRQWMLAMRAYCMKQAADKLTQGQNSSADYWSGLAEGWRKAASTGKITGVTKLARGACYVNPAEFDTHPDLMNAPNWVTPAVVLPALNESMAACNWLSSEFCMLFVTVVLTWFSRLVVAWVRMCTSSPI